MDRHARGDGPAEFAEAEARTVFPGDERTGVKDPVIRRAGGLWHAWICCHPLDEPGEEDRMSTAYATSAGGLAWTGTAPHSPAAQGPGMRAEPASPPSSPTGAPRTTAARARRKTSPSAPASPAAPGSPAGSSRAAARPVAAARYLDVVPLADGSHELRTELISR